MPFYLLSVPWCPLSKETGSLEQAKAGKPRLTTPPGSGQLLLAKVSTTPARISLAVTPYPQTNLDALEEDTFT